MKRLKMKNCNAMLIKKQQICIIIRHSAKYEYLTGEEMLPSDWSRTTEQAKFTYSSLVKAKKKNKNSWRSRKKISGIFKNFKTCWTKAKSKWIEDIYPKEQQNNEIKNN